LASPSGFLAAPLAKIGGTAARLSAVDRTDAFAACFRASGHLRVQSKARFLALRAHSPADLEGQITHIARRRQAHARLGVRAGLRPTLPGPQARPKRGSDHGGDRRQAACRASGASGLRGHETAVGGRRRGVGAGVREVKGVRRFLRMAGPLPPWPPFFICSGQCAEQGYAGRARPPAPRRLLREDKPANEVVSKSR
jgi:hypothetical protein